MDIELRNLKPRYMSESEVAGSDIYLQPSVRFKQGCRYMVCARSGHGKTSLLNFLFGASRQYDGEVLYHGWEGGDTFGLRLRHMSYMQQDLGLFPELTVLENVVIKNNLTHFKSDAEIEKMLLQVLPEEKLRQPLSTLSLGQRQRVAAVRAMCQPFCFLLLDEPFSHLDRQTAQSVANMMAAEATRQGAAIILTALDPVEMMSFDKEFQL